MSLNESIRYAAGDPVEQWLYELLCLDAASCAPRVSSGCPVPAACELYYVNRDTLFSFHRAAEGFLQRLMSLYVSSHYKVEGYNYRTTVDHSNMFITLRITITELKFSYCQCIKKFKLYLGKI